MADDVEAVRKAQRRKEIEEKRLKLQEMRKKKDDNIAKPTVGKAAAAVKTSSDIQTRAQATSVDELLETIQKDVASAAPAGQPPSFSSPSASSSHSEEKAASQLTTNKNVASVDIPPKRVIAYSCGVQTDPLERIESDDKALSSPPPSPSNLSRSHSSLPAAPAPAPAPALAPPVEKVLSEAEREVVLHSRSLLDFLENRVEVVERAISLNAKYDILKDYAAELERENSERRVGGGESGSIRIAREFASEKHCKYRNVMNVNWHPTHPELLLCAYSEPDAGGGQSSGLVLVWSLQSATEDPEFVFTSPSPVCAALFSKYDSRLIFGSTYSGQILMWDVRAKSAPVMVSPLSSAAHTHPVYSLRIVGTQNAHNLVSASNDGMCCTWRMDDLRHPVDILDLTVKTSGSIGTIGNPIGVTSMEFYSEETNSFLVGGEDGTIYKTYRHGSKKGEFEGFRGHYGPVTSVSSHPQFGPRDFSEYFLSSSMDWTLRLWNHKTPGECVFSFEDADDYISAVQWSPVHPSVFASCDGTGRLSLWDLNSDTEIPVVKQKVSSGALTCLSWEKSGVHLGVGTAYTDDAPASVKVFNVSDWASPDISQWSRFEETLNSLQGTHHVGK